MQAQILNSDPANASATLLLSDGSIINHHTLINFNNLIGQTGIYENGILTLPPTPPVDIVTADPATVFNGTFIYNTTTSTLKLGIDGSWITIFTGA